MRTWVLLRGLMRETRHWGEFVQRLQTHFPDDQIICIEWPGNGTLHQLNSLTSMSQMAVYCQQSLDSQGIAGPYHLIAVSLGAMAALQWAYQSPSLLASCTLINTSLRTLSPMYRRLEYRNWPSLVKMLFLSAPQREKQILALTSRTATASTLRQWQDYATQYPIRTSNALRQLWAASQYRPPATAPMPPLLILNSLGDLLVAPQCSQSIANTWHCPLRTHPTAGHDLPLDAPEWIIAQISEVFFKKTEGLQQNITLA